MSSGRLSICADCSCWTRQWQATDERGEHVHALHMLCRLSLGAAKWHAVLAKTCAKVGRKCRGNEDSQADCILVGRPSQTIAVQAVGASPRGPGADF